MKKEKRRKVKDFSKNHLTFRLNSFIIKKSLGGVAHLGERLNGIQEVRSSILLVSTKRKRAVRFLYLTALFNHSPICSS